MLKFDGDKLKRLRMQKELTQEQLGLLVGKKTADISNYENGFARPTLETYFALTECLKLPPKGLICKPSKEEVRA